jgi:hypothetical protein
LVPRSAFPRESDFVVEGEPNARIGSLKSKDFLAPQDKLMLKSYNFF